MKTAKLMPTLLVAAGLAGTGGAWAQTSSPRLTGWPWDGIDIPATLAGGAENIRFAPRSTTARRTQ